MKGINLKKVVFLAVFALVLTAFPLWTSAEIVQFTGDPSSLTYDFNLSGVPQYLWYHGCSPTSGGMLMGYWAENGYPQLLPNVTNPLVQTTAVNSDISSSQHNAKDTYAGHTANSIADFMKTVRGSTYLSNIATGLVAWSNYVGVTASAHDSYVSYYKGTFSSNDLASEISAGRPMLLNVMTYAPGYGWEGHTVLSYGFQASMFQIRIYNGTQYLNVTVPGFAVMDTWENGVGPGTQASWYGWNGQTVYAQKDSQGIEWWPFLDISLTKGHDFSNLWDWQVDDGVFYQPTGLLGSSGSNSGLSASVPVPVPGSLWLFSSGLVGLFFRRRKKAAEKVSL